MRMLIRLLIPNPKPYSRPPAHTEQGGWGSLLSTLMLCTSHTHGVCVHVCALRILIPMLVLAPPHTQNKAEVGVHIEAHKSTRL